MIVSRFQLVTLEESLESPRDASKHSGQTAEELVLTDEMMR